MSEKAMMTASMKAIEEFLVLIRHEGINYQPEHYRRLRVELFFKSDLFVSAGFTPHNEHQRVP